MDQETGIPEGWWRVLTYTNGQGLVVIGTPDEMLEPDKHSCDAMGCGSAQDHVIGRFDFAFPILKRG